MKVQSAGNRVVRTFLGRIPSVVRTTTPLLALAAALFINACSSDSSTGPTPQASANSHKPTHAGTDTSSTTGTISSNPIAGALFWIDPNSNAKAQADAWRSTRPADAAQMDKIATRSQSQWFGGWNANISTAINSTVTTIAATGALPVLVAYNIPQRDCGGLSGGGGATPDAYRSWIAAFASGLAGRKALVVLEPDALANIDCLSSADQQTRLDLLQYAVQVLKAQGQTIVYLDGGHPGWHSASDMASRLVKANVAAADGFFENVSNFYGTSGNISYGTSISSLIGGKHFIVDTSRNGTGPTADNQWCNPSGRALGAAATTQTGNALVDAFLWIKHPGESDGACNGGSSAGSWWADYALGLAQLSAL